MTHTNDAQCTPVRLDQYVNHDSWLIFETWLVFKARLLFEEIHTFPPPRVSFHHSVNQCHVFKTLPLTFVDFLWISALVSTK